MKIITPSHISGMTGLLTSLINSRFIMKIIPGIFIITQLMMCASTSIMSPEKILSQYDKLSQPVNRSKCYKGDCINGTGIYVGSGGEIFSGEFKSGKKNGKGVYVFKNKNELSVFEGYYVNGALEGEGKYVYSDDKNNKSKQYTGNYKNSKYNGKGELIETTGKHSKKYTGYFKDGLYHGEGDLTEVTYGGTNRYKGEFYEGHQHGIVEATYGDGSKYTGEYNHGRHHGKGTLIKPDGTVLEGVWENGEFGGKPAGYAYVKIKDGVQMRSEPSEKGSAVLLIPFGDQVGFYEETGKKVRIAGVSGKWVRVQYKYKIGWVFNGFLGKEPPSMGEENEKLEPDYTAKQLKQFPKVWTEVTGIDGAYYLFKTCNGRIAQIKINTSNVLNPKLIWESGQFDESFDISAFSKTADGGVFTMGGEKSLTVEMKYDSSRKKALWKRSDSGSESYFIPGNFRDSKGASGFSYKEQDKKECGR